MKKYRILKIISVVLALFNLLMYFSMRCCWSGISKTLGYEKNYSEFILQLPLIVFFLILITAIINIDIMLSGLEPLLTEVKRF